MSLPPKDVEPSELFLKLMEMPRPSEVVDYPRRGPDGQPLFKVRIQTLRTEEQDQARITAFRKQRERGIDGQDLAHAGMREVYADAVAKEILAVSVTDVVGVENPGNGRTTYGRMFRNGDDLGKLPPDELLYLFNAWQLVQAKFGVSEKLDPDQAESWIKRLVEGGSAYPLLSLAWQDLHELTMSLAERTYTLYALLATQLSSLPPSLAAHLASSTQDISYYGGPPAGAASHGGGSRPDAPVTAQAVHGLARHQDYSGED